MRHSTKFDPFRPDQSGFVYVVGKRALDIDGRTYAVGEVADVSSLPNRRFQQLVRARYLQPKGPRRAGEDLAGKKTGRAKGKPGATNLLPPESPASVPEISPDPSPVEQSPADGADAGGA